MRILGDACIVDIIAIICGFAAAMEALNVAYEVKDGVISPLHQLPDGRSPQFGGPAEQESSKIVL